MCGGATIAFWITLILGVLAVTLGVTLLFWPDKARPMLTSSKGMFWLVSGVVSLRWGAAHSTLRIPNNRDRGSLARTAFDR